MCVWVSYPQTTTAAVSRVCACPILKPQQPPTHRYRVWGGVLSSNHDGSRLTCLCVSYPQTTTTTIPAISCVWGCPILKHTERPSTASLQCYSMICKNAHRTNTTHCCNACGMGGTKPWVPAPNCWYHLQWWLVASVVPSRRCRHLMVGTTRNVAMYAAWVVPSRRCRHLKFGTNRNVAMYVAWVVPSRRCRHLMVGTTCSGGLCVAWVVPSRRCRHLMVGTTCNVAVHVAWVVPSRRCRHLRRGTTCTAYETTSR